LTAASAAKDLALAEARDDLRRDEAIFAEKMREIKALKREAKAVAKASVARNARDAERGPLAKASAETPERGTAPLSPSARPMDRRDPNDFDGVRNGNDEANARGTLPPLGGALPATPLSEPFGASSPSSLSETAELEKKSLVRQKAEIELERAQLRREAARRARAYQQEKKSLERQLRELARNIGSKEKLIVDLTRNEREANLLTRRYEDKVRSLEEEKASKEAEAARLRSELQGLIERAAKRKRTIGPEKVTKTKTTRFVSRTRRKFAPPRRSCVRCVWRKHRATRFSPTPQRSCTPKPIARRPTRRASSSRKSRRCAPTRRRCEMRLREQHARDASFASSAPDATAAAELADLRRERELQSAKIEALASNETRHLEALRRATDELAAAKATIRRLGGGGENRALQDVGDAPARGRPIPRNSTRFSERTTNERTFARWWRLRPPRLWRGASARRSARV
jgi:DNA repair exonuclease SbcCD ATPase subunit